MSADRWRMVKGLFQRALDVPCDEWPAYLDTVCAGDGELRREVESLLAEYDPSATEIFRRHEVLALVAGTVGPNESGGRPERLLGPSGQADLCKGDGHAE